MASVLGSPSNRRKLANFRTMATKATTMTLERLSSKATGRTEAISSIRTMADPSTARTTSTRIRGRISIRKDPMVNRTRAETSLETETQPCRCQSSKSGKINSSSTSRINPSTKNKESSRTLKDKVRASKSSSWGSFSHRTVRSARCCEGAGSGRTSHASSVRKDSAHGVVLDKSACGQTTN